jgi:hypothetical protein
MMCVHAIYCPQKASKMSFRYTFKDYWRLVSRSFGRPAVLRRRRKGKHSLENSSFDIQTTLWDTEQLILNLLCICEQTVLVLYHITVTVNP